MQFVQDLPALHPWWVDVGFEFAHKKWQYQHNKTTQFTRFLTSWAALDNYKKLRKRLFIKYSLKQQKSKNLFPSSQIPKTQILNSLFPLTFPATKQGKKKKKKKPYKFSKISRSPQIYYPTPSFRWLELQQRNVSNIPDLQLHTKIKLKNKTWSTASLVKQGHSEWLPTCLQECLSGVSKKHSCTVQMEIFFTGLG